MTVGATLVASLLATLARPATWPLSLSAFLLRGGFLLVLAPIVVLPSAVALSNVVAPVVTTIALRGVAPIALPLTALAGAVLLWLVGGGLLASAVESDLIRRLPEEDEAWPDGRPVLASEAADGAVWRVLAVRLVAHLPSVLAVSWGAIRIVTVAYRELTAPSDVAVALVLRIFGGAPDAVAILLVAWVFGETLGSLAVRRVVMLGDRVPGALGRALVWLVRRPIRCAALALLPLVPHVLVLVLVGVAGSAAWSALRGALALGGDPLATLGLLVALVAVFAAGLLLIGVVSAWRAAIWTVEVAGTFGVGRHGPEGQWNGGTDSGTLGDLRPRGVDPDTR
jgi:hypothetical protein